MALATANTQKAGERSASPRVACDPASGCRPPAVAGVSPSTVRPMVSGMARTSVHARGANPSTSDNPTMLHATRHPCWVTIPPTIGKAAMNPTLMATA